MAAAKQQELTAVLDDLAAIEAEEQKALAEFEEERRQRLAAFEERKKAASAAAVNHPQAEAFVKLCIESGRYNHLLPQTSTRQRQTSSGGSGSRENRYYLKHPGTGKVLASEVLDQHQHKPNQ